MHTLPAYRRRGRAAALLTWVEEQQNRRGAALSLLYSDIDPAYYARLGYRRCPAWEGWVELHGTPPSDEDDGWRLARFEPRGRLDELMRQYAAYHGAAPLAVARSPSYWEVVLAKSPADEFHWLMAPNGETMGYARLGRLGDALKIADYALAHDDESLLARLYDQMVQLAGETRPGSRRRVASRYSGRALPVSPATAPPRNHHGQVVAPDLALDDSLLAAADRFCEIDHV